MKKVIPLLLSLIVCLSLCACSEKDDTKPTQPSQPPQPSQSTPDTTPHEHNYSSVVTPPSCTEQGYTTYTCACGNSYITDQIDAIAHDYQETAKVDASSNQDGSVTYTCSGCGDSYEEVLCATGSAGLEYALNDDGTYTVVSIGTCTDARVVIPRYYEDAKVTAIGKRAFYNCTTIEEITIPDTISDIGTQIFYKALNLKTVYYYSRVGGSDDNIFLQNTSVEKVVFGGTVIPSYILSNVKSVREVIIESSVIEIGESAFENCPNLTSLNIPNGVQKIGKYAFSSCINLSEIVIPDSVTTLSQGAFYGCKGLTKITLPSNLTSISKWLFTGCVSLSEIIIPTSVESIGSEAFSDCVSLTTVTIPDSVISIDSFAFEDCTNLTDVTIPDSVTVLNDYAFSGCVKLNNVIIPDSISDLTAVFMNCTGLTNVTIPDSVTNLYVAFNECTNLRSITIPDSVVELSGAFMGCTNLFSITYEGTIEQWNAISKNTFYDWDSGMPHYTVHCTDGDISK